MAPPSAILTVEMLAARWSLSIGDLQRRLKLLRLPGVNVGTAKRPDYRFRVSAIEAWEFANERILSSDPNPFGQPIPVEGLDLSLEPEPPAPPKPDEQPSPKAIKPPPVPRTSRNSFDLAKLRETLESGAKPIQE